ncbi:hypothetical protein J422_00255 [Methanocaldococcus villosus KIN24-T80]|uniref:DUF434 domain-containing protein n=1 Tax=Methanocaldococcus villosus KIN24-T80 TaxID=1069083 RepID=N6W0D1_9EURY|nr:DUF434 domain-containing protein [Methanocaldococcus villosus]ENN96832.1 hypothetical protein J422_00255 [Methanocaldococcus villosus KIN24-T80]
MSNKKIEEAKKDFKYLINRGYKKEVAINFVGNHYKLTKLERLRILREVHSDKEIEIVKNKLTPLKELKRVYVDGFNVLITIEAFLKNRVFLCDDGIYRDLERVYGKYKIGEYTEKAIKLLLNVLKDKEFCIYLDAQVSKSGELARRIREKIEKMNLKGKVLCVKNCDSILKTKPAVMTSDLYIILSEDVKHVVDIIKEVK